MHLHIQKDPDSLSYALAEWIITDIKETLIEKDHYTLVLSGGSTPKKLYKLLASDIYCNQVEWKRIHLFWGDERYVPFEDERNNGRMAYNTLLKYVPIPKEQIHYMNTTLPPEQSARQYEKLLYQYFNDSPLTFDLVLLGMGDDGHTLSLFPGSPFIHEQHAWVAAPYIKAQGMYRITLTPPVVNKSSAVTFLATGEKKAGVLKKIIQGPYNPDIYPSQIIKPVNSNLHWFVDEAAASQLPKKS